MSYCEKHHVVPRSLGGGDDTENLVWLTAKEHLIAHKLLVRITTGDNQKKMLNALWAMATMRNSHNKDKRALLSAEQFARLRETYFESRRGQPISEETRQKISSSLTGRKIPEETIKKRTSTLKLNIQTGKTEIKRAPLSCEKLERRNAKYRLSYTPEKMTAAVEKMKLTKQNWSDEMKREYSRKLSAVNTGKKRTEEQRKNISRGLLGHHVSLDTRQKISDAQRGKVKEAVMEFTLVSPLGETSTIRGKIQDISRSTGAGVKYLYLSLKNGEPIKKGAGKGWRLISKRRVQR
jgi:hypothetical protein